MSKKWLLFNLLAITPLLAAASTPYEQRLHRYVTDWSRLIPTHTVAQNAGNMGALSMGIGWDYGRRHWETQFMLGLLPKHQSGRAKLTMTVKQNYIPWHLPLGGEWSLQPLTATAYVNTVFGRGFWGSQPSRYPNGYYFMSTKAHANLGVGSRITWHIPREKRKFLVRSVSLFYEVSSCDLYLRAKYLDSTVPLSDILGLSIGVKLQTL